MYPGLTAHEVASTFAGGFFTRVFRPGFRTVSLYEKVIEKLLAEAKRKNVALVGGTSFGFNTTRVYIVAQAAPNLEGPFVRVSLGTETIEEVSALCRVFETILKDATYF